MDRLTELQKQINILNEKVKEHSQKPINNEWRKQMDCYWTEIRALKTEVKNIISK